MTPHQSGFLRQLRPAFAAVLVAAIGAIATPAIGALAPVHAQGAPACQTPAASDSPPTQGAATNQPYVQISFTNDCNDSVPLYVDVAANDAEEQQGLMGVNPLPENEGELFVFNNIAQEQHTDQVHVSFWMKDTPIPLSIAFIAKDGTISEIQDMQAESIDLHTPALPYLYAVEANQGWFATNDISDGDTVNLASALAMLNASPSP